MSSLTNTPQQKPISIRQSPRLSGSSGTSTKPPPGPATGSTSDYSHIDVHPAFFQSPPMYPLSTSLQQNIPHPTVPAASSASSGQGGGQGGGEFATPAPVTHSPLVQPVNAMGFMKSLNRTGDISAPLSARSSRRGSLSTAALPPFDESKHTGSAAQLRSATTSPTMTNRHFQHPLPASPSQSGFDHPAPFDTPSLGASATSLSGSKTRYAHSISRPFNENSPFMAPSRRSPRGHSPFQPFGSPSPNLGASLSSASPSISFALPSPSLLGMNTPHLGSTSRERDLNGGLSMNMSSTSMLNSHIFNHWEGESIRRSPRFTPHQMPLSASRRSPSFTMFSPPAHAQQHPHYGHPPDLPSGTTSAQSSRPGSTVARSRNLRDNNTAPMMSPALNSVPSSPNLSILGKLRSLHNHDSNQDSHQLQHDSRSVSPAKLDDMASSSAHSHTSGGKRGRSEYESSDLHHLSTSPNPSQQQNYPYHHSHSNSKSTPHFGSSITSPAVGSLPPSHMSLDVDHSPALQSYHSSRSPPVTSNTGGHKRLSQKLSLKQKHESSTPHARQPRQKVQPVEEPSSPEPIYESQSSTGTGSGSSCHQCKSRRLIVDLVFCCNMWKKGKDRKVAASATSQQQHSCRKKYCGSCLVKFYNERPPVKRSAHNSEFVCPACRGICCCAACRRIKARILGEIDPTVLSPASMLAYSYVYCPEVLLQSMGDEDVDLVDPAKLNNGSNSPSTAASSTSNTAALTSAQNNHAAHFNASIANYYFQQMINQQNLINQQQQQVAAAATTPDANHTPATANSSTDTAVPQGGKRGPPPAAATSAQSVE